MDKELRSAYLRTENKEQNVFDSESRSDSSVTVQKNTEVIHREVEGRTKINCYMKENPSEFSETCRLKDLVKEHSELGTRRRAALHVVRNSYTSEDGETQTNLAPE